MRGFSQANRLGISDWPAIDRELPDGMVRKPLGTQLRRLVEIATIENHRGCHRLPQGREVGPAEIPPLGHHGQCIGSGSRIERIGGIFNPITLAVPNLVHRLRIENPDHR